MEITFYRKLANKVSDAVISNQAYSEIQEKKIRYGLVCIFSDLYKFILFLVIFSIFSFTREFLLAFIGILALRPFIAGYHAKSEITCIIISFTTMLVSVLLGNMNLLPSFVQVLLIILLPIVGGIIAPVQTNKTIVKKNFKLKLLTGFLTFIILLVDYFFLARQILFISVTQIYFLTLYQVLKNYTKFS